MTFATEVYSQFIASSLKLQHVPMKLRALMAGSEPKQHLLEMLLWLRNGDSPYVTNLHKVEAK